MAKDATTASVGDTEKSQTPHDKELEVEIAALRQDIANITETLSDMVRDTGRNVGRSARRQKRQAFQSAEQAKDRVVEGYGHYEDEVQEMIREKPLTSVLVAASVGFVLSKIL